MPDSKPKPDPQARKKPRRKLLKAAAWFVGLALLLVLTLPALISLVPLPAGLLEPPPRDPQLVDRHDRPLRELYREEGYLGQGLALADISEHLVHATLAAEDKRFWTHGGVDWRAAARAAWGMVRHRRVVSGASTVTMQLVKISNPRPRTFRSKVIEAAQALRLEQVWSKERILAEYLNRLDYGNRRFGCAAASQYYFGKPPSDLSAAEAAFLAGLPQAPTRLNPHSNPNRVAKRQLWILERMQQVGSLDEAAHERAIREPIKLKAPHRVFRAPHFVDLLLQLETEAIRGNPGKAIRTTLDLDLNGYAERVLRQQLETLHRQNVLNGAVVVLDNRSGDVLALVGSDNYFNPDEGQVNGAWAPRSAGSTFKPFTYLIAIEQGATPATVAADVPTEFATPTGIFAPLNYNRRFHGPVRYRLALANSLNIPAVRVLESIGGAPILQSRLTNAGLTTLTQPAEHYGLGLTIGNAEARLLELANAYASLARLGEFKPFQLVAGPGRHPEVARRIFDGVAAYLVADMLSDNEARALAFGVHSPLRFDFPVACKTGTSSDFRDNWAFGYTPEFTVAVWVGNFSGEPMRDVSGVTGAAPVMHDLMVHLRERFGTSWYATPEGIVERPVHPLSGKLTATDATEMAWEKFSADNLPPFESASDYDDQGRLRLPPEYSEWISSPANWLANRVVATDTIADHKILGLRIVSPLPGTVIYLDPDLPRRGEVLRLKAEGNRRIQWQSATLELQDEREFTQAILVEGRHEIIATCPDTGARASSWIQVKTL